MMKVKSQANFHKMFSFSVSLSRQIFHFRFTCQKFFFSHVQLCFSGFSVLKMTRHAMYTLRKATFLCFRPKESHIAFLKDTKVPEQFDWVKTVPSLSMPKEGEL